MKTKLKNIEKRKPAGQSTALDVAAGSPFVWQRIAIPHGRSKWVEVSSSSWVTDAGDGWCFIGLRGEYLGKTQQPVETCKNDIEKMLSIYAKHSSPNDAAQPTAPLIRDNPNSSE